MPHAGGAIHVVYTLTDARWTAEVTLPAGLSGSFLWKGKRSPLKAGTQTFTLP
jgi:hypothetical protein